MFVSFPPLSNMLKFSGYSHFIRDLISSLLCCTEAPRQFSQSKQPIPVETQMVSTRGELSTSLESALAVRPPGAPTPAPREERTRAAQRENKTVKTRETKLSGLKAARWRTVALSIRLRVAIKHAVELRLNRYSKRRAPRHIPRAHVAFKDLMIH